MKFSIRFYNTTGRFSIIFDRLSPAATNSQNYRIYVFGCFEFLNDSKKKLIESNRTRYERSGNAWSKD